MLFAVHVIVLRVTPVKVCRRGSVITCTFDLNSLVAIRSYFPFPFTRDCELTVVDTGTRAVFRTKRENLLLRILTVPLCQYTRR